MILRILFSERFNNLYLVLFIYSEMFLVFITFNIKGLAISIIPTNKTTKSLILKPEYIVAS